MRITEAKKKMIKTWLPKRPYQAIHEVLKTVHGEGAISVATVRGIMDGRRTDTAGVWEIATKMAAARKKVAMAKAAQIGRKLAA